MNGYAPNGEPIVALLEKVEAHAKIDPDSFTRDGEFSHTGETEAVLENRRTVMEDGEPVFLDAQGNTWKKSEIEVMEGPYSPHAAPMYKVEYDTGEETVTAQFHTEAEREAFIEGIERVSDLSKPKRYDPETPQSVVVSMTIEQTAYVGEMARENGVSPKDYASSLFDKGLWFERQKEIAATTPTSGSQ